jgi:hypothetical protein
MTDDELRDAAAATYAMPRSSPPGLLAWIEHCVDVEQKGRKGMALPLLPPESPIPPGEEAAALAAMIALWEAADADNVRTLYAAMVKLLSAGPPH